MVNTIKPLKKSTSMHFSSLRPPAEVQWTLRLHSISYLAATLVRTSLPRYRQPGSVNCLHASSSAQDTIKHNLSSSTPSPPDTNISLLTPSPPSHSATTANN
ncbi:unnamed protein product [Heterobilharzia americana]|nr:unnamed protein product [Heterobilharzia americana]